MAADRSIVMPKLGLTMTEGVVSEWKIAPGDAVKAGDVLFVVETDKIANEVEASEAGVIAALHVAEGDVVEVGATVATYAGSGGSAVTALAPPPPPPVRIGDTPAAEAAVPAPVVIGGADAERRIATPLARRMAANAGIDLAIVSGRGPRGRIMADDVAAALAAKPEAAPPVSAGAPVSGGVLHPLGQYQAIAARRLTESKQTIPHFYVMAEADVTDLIAARASLNGDAAFTKLTVNHFLIAAVARALAAMPAINRVWAGNGVLELPAVDIGLAVEGAKGLVAPLLRDLAKLTLDEIAAAASALVERARAGKLGAGELEGGATTISNVGMFGATGLIPIVNPGQSSILGVGRNRPQYQPDEHGQPSLRQMLTLTLSCDHRVIDGALAARFLNLIQTGLEAPLSLLRSPPRKTIP